MFNSTKNKINIYTLTNKAGGFIQFNDGKVTFSSVKEIKTEVINCLRLLTILESESTNEYLIRGWVVKSGNDFLYAIDGRIERFVMFSQIFDRLIETECIKIVKLTLDNQPEL